MKTGRLYLILFMSVMFLGMRPCCVTAAEYSLDDLYKIALQRAEKIFFHTFPIPCLMPE